MYIHISFPNIRIKKFFLEKHILSDSYDSTFKNHQKILKELRK